jgi:hypothetical protein
MAEKQCVYRRPEHESCKKIQINLMFHKAHVDGQLSTA